jgi:hypothetical protein
MDTSINGENQSPDASYASHRGTWWSATINFGIRILKKQLGRVWMLMKAWIVWDRFNEENAVLIFADKRGQAKHDAWSELDCDFIDIAAKRAQAFDGMENATKKEIVEKQLSEGWNFEDVESGIWVSSENVDYVDEQGNAYPLKEG